VSVARQFGENLVYVRRQAHLTQEEVSFRASVHRTEISQLERGLRVARIDTLVKLAGALKVNPDELLDGIEWESGKAVIGRFIP
jgi:transcriptional regulator with XRE-family HTH domain